MEYVENSGNLSTAIASKKLKNIDSEPRSLKQSDKTLVLKNMPEEVEDIYNVVLDVNEDDELQHVKLQPEDVTESKLDEKMIYLLELLEASINILEDVDKGKTDSLLLLNDVDDESGYDYVICDRQKRPPHEYVGDTGNLNDDTVVQENHRNEFGSEANNSIITSATKKQNRKCYELNDFYESFVVVLMLFSLYFLLSNII